MIKVVFLTVGALVAFAANSVLCRMALGNDLIDAATFTLVRLATGVVVLLLLVSARIKELRSSAASWLSGSMLFLYAIAFSYAYVSLDTGTGALVLFGSVQITMLCIALMKGEKLHAMEWLGIGIAFLGLVLLMLPGATKPSVTGFTLMLTAGLAWGIYTARGVGSMEPLLDTASNFLRTLPLLVILVVLMIRESHWTEEGLVLAMISGGVASGVGYAVWYSALKYLASTQAAVFQLSVPIIAALGGVLFMSELITGRLVGSAVMILGGILMVLWGRRSVAQTQNIERDP